MRYKLNIEYEGTRYNGWQIQKDGKTIMGEFFKAIKEAFGTSTFEFYGAGRTDGGVHALHQVAHLEISTKLSLKNIQYKLNDLLPHDINVFSIETAHPKFHARFDAVARSYVYHIAKRRTAFGKAFVWWVKDNLDVQKMQDAADCFLGLKDYSNIAAQSTDEQSPKCEIRHFNIHESENSILIHIVGSHFLWKQVRRMVGLLVETGRGKLTISELNSFFTKKSDLPAKLTAPPSGLYLERVYYPGDEISLKFDTLINL